MLKIDTQSRAPVRVELPGDAWIEFKPLGTAGLQAGRAVIMKTLEAGEDVAVANVAFTIAVARWGALAWGGIGDASGKPLDLSPDHVQLLLEQSEEAFGAVSLGYVAPALRREAEKNGSAPARLGTSRAPRKKPRTGKAPGVADATATPARRAAKPAPTKSSNHKPNSAKRSGG